jgi:putative endonuclease
MVDRRERARRGARAEQLAAEHLEDHGYRILDRNLRVGRLEIDILARHGDAAVVVEVRTRGAGAWQSALASIGHDKQLRLRRAGQILWSRRFRHDPDVKTLRFDVAAVDLEAEPPVVELVRAAF